MLKVEKLHKKYKQKNILLDISLEFSIWEVHVIVWPSWAWKSTLLSCIWWITDFCQWSISMYGWDINKNSYPELSVMLQWRSLWPHMTMYENIVYPLKHNKIFDEQEVVNMINHLKINHIIDKYPENCSGWEKQRVSLARHLLLESKFLLMDEVTSALDVEHVQSVVQLIKKAKLKTWLLVVTHSINFAKKIADYIYFMDQWKIVERWEVHILTNPQTQRFKEFLDHY